MRQAILTRNETSDVGTFGTIMTDSGFNCRTGELPWRNNKTGSSCIPAGKYICNWRFSATHGYCYHIEDVEGRSAIEIHAANFMGDKSLGLKCELLGCIAPGLSIGMIDGQRGVTFSRQTLTQLENDLARQSFQLTIDDIQTSSKLS